MRQGLSSVALASPELATGWPETHKDPSAFTFQVLRLKTCATASSLFLTFEGPGVVTWYYVSLSLMFISQGQDRLNSFPGRLQGLVTSQADEESAEPAVQLPLPHLSVSTGLSDASPMMSPATLCLWPLGQV